jgi:hypothetical protein
MAEKEAVKPRIAHGPSNNPQDVFVPHGSGGEVSSDGVWWFEFARNEATPTQSYYLYSEQLPSQIVFGVNGGKPQYHVRLGNPPPTQVGKAGSAGDE